MKFPYISDFSWVWTSWYLYAMDLGWLAVVMSLVYMTIEMGLYFRMMRKEMQR